MKKLLVILSFFPFCSGAQDVFPFIDYIGYLKSFEYGQVQQIDYLRPVDVTYSEEVVAYIDNKNDFFIYDGEDKEKMTGMANGYQVGMNLVAWNTGPIVSVWNDGRKRTLTQFGRNYKVSDSLVVFDDTRDNAIRVYYKDSIYDLFYSVGELNFPKNVGSNSVGFTGNGNILYCFVAGKIIEIGVLNNPVNFEAGANLVAFNDPFNQSFAVAHANEILDVEPITVRDYKAGYDLVVYRDRNNNLKCYDSYKVVNLSNYTASHYDIFRDLIVWGENGLFNAYYKGKKYEIANYIPQEYKIRDGIVAFRNLNGGVSVFYNEKVEIISNVPGAEFEVNGNTVMVKIARGNFLFFKDGELFQI
ncbi:MAG: hypothetical protein R3277_02470 [Brumimicrobium sp.]|nr:hypothetical protein [Brumimicrobium sp.]